MFLHEYIFGGAGRKRGSSEKSTSSTQPNASSTPESATSFHTSSTQENSRSSKRQRGRNSTIPRSLATPESGQVSSSQQSASRAVVFPSSSQRSHSSQVSSSSAEKSRSTPFSEHEYQTLLNQNLLEDAYNYWKEHNITVYIINRTRDRNGASLLSLSVKYKKDHLLSELLEIPNIEVNIPNNNNRGSTPLLTATFYNEEAAIKLLSLNKTDIYVKNRAGQNAFMLAAMLGHLDIINILLEKGFSDINDLTNDDHHSAITYAARGNKTDVVRRLLELNGLNRYNIKHAMYIAIENYFPLIVRELLTRNDINLSPELRINFSPELRTAVSRSGNRPQVVECFLERNDIDVNYAHSGGFTALISAMEHGYYRIVEVLLQRPDLDVNKKRSSEISPLMVAVQRNHYLCVRELLRSSDLDVNAQNTLGNTALIMAVKRNHYLCVRLLLRRDNLDVNIRYTNGNTALLEAVKYPPDLRIVRLLSGVDNIRFNIKDYNGKDALDIARDYALDPYPPIELDEFTHREYIKIFNILSRTIGVIGNMTYEQVREMQEGLRSTSSTI